MAYVRQQAWLVTAPDIPRKGEKQDLPNKTHLEILESKYGDSEWFSQIIQQPDLPLEIILWAVSFQGDVVSKIDLPYELAHIWAHLLEVGPAGVGAMGIVPLSYLEIKAWADLTKTILTPWETVLLHKCSQEWVSALYKAKQPTAIPPWTGQNIEDRRKHLSEIFKKTLQSRVKKKGLQKGKK